MNNNFNEQNNRDNNSKFSDIFSSLKNQKNENISPINNNNYTTYNSNINQQKVENSIYTNGSNYNKYEKRKKSLVSVLLASFYLLCFAFIIIGIFYWYTSNEIFYLAKSDISMIVDDSYTIDIYGKTAKNNKNYIYTSSNPDIITVDELGVVHSKSEGEATVTIKSKYSNKKNVLNVIVQGDSIYSVEFENDSISLNLKETMKLNPIVNGNSDFKAFFTWSSENSKIVSVSSNGEILGEAPGTTYIKVRVKGTKLESRVKVNVTGQSIFNENNTQTDTVVIGNDAGYEEAINKYIGVVSVSIKTPKTELMVGENIKVSANISPNNATNKEVVWGTSDESIATIDKNGNIKAIKEGTVDITVKTIDGNKTAFITLKVKNKKSNTKITLSKNNVELQMAQVEVIKAQVSDNQPLHWSSSNPDIATVDNNGLITAKKEGNAVITCTTKDNKTSESVNVTVVGIIKINPVVKIQSIVLNRSSLQLGINKTFDLKVSIKPTNATNKNLSYSSSNSSVVSVDKNGKIKTLKYGTATIRVSTTDGSGKVAYIKVVSVPNVGAIGINNKKYTTYISNIENYINTSYPKHMQNFAIQNLGKSNEIIYLSGVTTGSIKAKSITAAQKANLNRTIIVSIPKSQIKTNKTKRTIMWLKKSGHGQPFDIEADGTIWVNAVGKEPRYSGGIWWGSHNGIMRIKFKSNTKDANFSSLVTLRAKDSSGKVYGEPDVSVDEANNLIALRSNNKVFVYNLNDAKKGKLNLLYSFSVASASTYRQGQDLFGGFFYMLNGAAGGQMSITAYNMLGEIVYTKNFYIKNAKQAKTNNEEPEGLKIYGGKIYIGFTHKKGNGSLFDIGVFK